MTPGAQFVGTTLGMIVVAVLIVWVLLWFFVPFMIHAMHNRLTRVEDILTQLNHTGYDIVRELRKPQPKEPAIR